MIHRLLTLHVLALTACGATGGLEPLPVVEPITVVESIDDPEPDESPVELVEISPTLELPEPDPFAPVPPPAATYALRRGETLAHFARWSGLPLEVIAQASGLSPADDHLPVGAAVALPIDEETRALVETRREAHHLTRAEGYLESRGGAIGSEFYTVRTGDSATTIARDQAGIPVWLLETYNPSVDLEKLRPGQELLLPVLGDTVAQGD